MLRICQTNTAKWKWFNEIVPRFPWPTVEENRQGGGRPDGSDAGLPLAGVGTRFVDLFIQVGQESDDWEAVPKMLCQIKTCMASLWYSQSLDREAVISNFLIGS